MNNKLPRHQIELVTKPSPTLYKHSIKTNQSNFHPLILHSINVISLTYISVSVVLPSHAFTLSGNINGGPGKTENTSSDGNYKVSLTTVPVTQIKNPNDFKKYLDNNNLLNLDPQGQFNKWKFKIGQEAKGDVNILQYDAFAAKTVGGANFTALYNDGDKTPRTDYNWIQIATTKNWGSFDSTTFIDNPSFLYNPNNPKTSPFPFPFYADYTPENLAKPDFKISKEIFDGFASEGNIGSIWLDDKNYPEQKIQNPAGGGKIPAGDLLFIDTPFCKYTCTNVNGQKDTSSIDFELFLVSFDLTNNNDSTKGGTITIHDGLKWGVKIDCINPQQQPKRLALGSEPSVNCEGKDFGDAPDSYQTLLSSDGPQYKEGELQRLGKLWDTEPDGQPTIPADGDDNSILGGCGCTGNLTVDDEDGVIFGDRWVDVILNITREGINPYQLSAWWDTNKSGTFEHSGERYINELLNLSPGQYTFRYKLDFDPKDYYSRFRLTWNPTEEVKPWGEVLSPDGVSHGEVEDYAPVPEPTSLLALVGFGVLGLSSMRKGK
jgi:PEP-CTERM motif